MERQKLHISPALRLGIAVILMLCCLGAAVGVTFARYQAEKKEGLIFQPDRNAQVYLGHMTADGFVCEQNQWVNAQEQLQLAFAISNGPSDTEFSSMDQVACLRVVASLGAWNEEMATPLYLTVGEQVYAAAAQRIVEGTVLYTQFGDGWVFRFQDENGKEPQWELSGGRFDCVQMLLYMDAAIADTGLLRLQVVAEVK